MNLVRKDRSGLIHCALQLFVRELSQTLQRIRGRSTPRILNQFVVGVLTTGDIADGDRCTGLHEGTSEQSFRISPVRKHLKGD